MKISILFLGVICFFSLQETEGAGLLNDVGPFEDPDPDLFQAEDSAMEEPRGCEYNMGKECKDDCDCCVNISKCNCMLGSYLCSCGYGDRYTCLDKVRKCTKNRPHECPLPDLLPTRGKGPNYSNIVNRLP
uniref:Toxin 38 isoform c n=1 Tax=Cupiennius salei TaxID=6928 RepID=A0A4Y5UGQ0_CUPSA|nr:toxin 38 isoform c precursor [Cupiennius salei]